MKQAPSLLLALLASAFTSEALAADWRGMVDLRATASHAHEASWIREGLGKTRSGEGSPALYLGQAIVRGEAELADTVSAALVLGAAGDRRGLIDVNEAWLAWKPVPGSAWKHSVKAGAFFPPTSVETDYDTPGWTPTRTISGSAINSWIGEEIRTTGIEWRALRRGRFAGSPHDFGVTLAAFKGNDPTATLLSWRGWSIGDRITGLNETLRLADLPVYRPAPRRLRQTRDIHVFRELDGRAGFYAGAEYGYGGMLEAAVLHYDNKTNPLVLSRDEWGWRTRFDHASLRLQPAPAWELLAQAMHGSTVMGPNLVKLDFRSWYALASRTLGTARITLRYDRFSATESAADRIASDPNGETGHALALAWSWRFAPAMTVVTELLSVHSTRPARSLLGVAPYQAERSLTTALRWDF